MLVMVRFSQNVEMPDNYPSPKSRGTLRFDGAEERAHIAEAYFEGGYLIMVMKSGKRIRVPDYQISYSHEVKPFDVKAIAPPPDTPSMSEEKTGRRRKPVESG